MKYDPSVTADRLFDLHHIYVHLAAYGTEDHDELDDAGKFRELVHRAQCFQAIEETKEDVLATGYPIPESWLTVLDAAKLDRGEPSLPEAARQRVLGICKEIYAVVIRLNSAPLRALQETGAGEVTVKKTKDRSSRRGPARMPLKGAWRYLTIVQEWAGIRERNQKLSMRDRYQKVQLAEKHGITTKELNAMLGWYAKHKREKRFPDDPRTVSKGELAKWFV